MRSFIANINDDGVRLNRFCEKLCPNMPKSLLNKAFRNKRIKVNGKKQSPDYRINKGDLLELYINDEFFISKPLEKAINTNLKLDVIYEDENIILVFKPAGLLTHSDNKNQDTVISWLINYLNFNKENENTFTPSVANRLDQGTQGIVICAKNYKALRDINEIIKQNLLLKSYVCITKGKIVTKEYKAYLTRDKNIKKVSITKNKTENSKEIITQVEVLDKKSDFNLLKVNLITGRTHQIRAHLQYLNCPILGDRKYGIYDKNLKSQLLCAYKIEFKNIPIENTFNYLSNKIFKQDKNMVTDYFNKI